MGLDTQETCQRGGTTLADMGNVGGGKAFTGLARANKAQSFPVPGHPEMSNEDTRCMSSRHDSNPLREASRSL